MENSLKRMGLPAKFLKVRSPAVLQIYTICQMTSIVPGIQTDNTPQGLIWPEITFL